MWVIRHKAPKAAFIWGLWTGLVTNLGGFYWITAMLQDFGHFSLPAAIPLCILLCAYQGIVPALWAGITRWLMLRTKAPILLVAPIVWVVVEYSVPFIFPWYFANGQYLFYPAIQIVELTGVLGLSWLIVLVNTGLFRGIELAYQRRYIIAWRPVAIAAVLFTLNIAYGTWRIDAVDREMAEAPSLRIGVGEANVGIFEKEARHLTSGHERLWMLRGNIMKHHLLAAELERDPKIDLIVEPESSFIPVPYPYGTVRYKRTDLFAATVSTQGDMWERHDGSWTQPKSLGTEIKLHSVSAAREDVVIAVGNNGAVFRRSNGDWTREDSGTDQHLRAIWVGEHDPQFARLDGAPTLSVVVGDKGTILTNEGGGWKPSDSGTQVRLNGIDGKSQDDVLTAGANGAVLHWNGDQWKAQEVDTTVRLNDVEMTKSGVNYVVGNHGTLLVQKRKRWKKKKLGNNHLNGITSDGSEVIVVGNGGAMFVSSGGSFRRINAGTTTNLNAVDFDGDDNAWVVGDNGLILQRAAGKSSWTESQLMAGKQLSSVAGIPFTEAHTYARDSRYLYRSKEPLPKVSDKMKAVADINTVLPDDRNTSLHAWNTPLRGFNTPILLGLLTYEPKAGTISAPLQGRNSRRTYNSAILIDGDGRVRGRYDKNYLLVFGEYIPLGSTFPQFYDWLPEASHFEAGTTVETFDFKGFQLGVMICYEDIIPRFTRRLAGKNPNVLINVTNDAWFGKTSEPYLHLALAIFRAVENRLWLIRSTNTGVSAYVDAVGRLVSQTRLEDPEILAEDVPMMSTVTPYRRYGDLFSYACIVAFLLLASIGFIKKRA
jgi:apolipoprotein N-acyltransferase/photosystem II stability/assembly factor-like uncharacterized protein